MCENPGSTERSSGASGARPRYRDWDRTEDWLAAGGPRPVRRRRAGTGRPRALPGPARGGGSAAGRGGRALHRDGCGRARWQPTGWCGWRWRGGTPSHCVLARRLLALMESKQMWAPLTRVLPAMIDAELAAGRPDRRPALVGRRARARRAGLPARRARPRYGPWRGPGGGRATGRRSPAFERPPTPTNGCAAHTTPPRLAIGLRPVSFSAGLRPAGGDCCARPSPLTVGSARAGPRPRGGPGAGEPSLGAGAAPRRSSWLRPGALAARGRGSAARGGSAARTPRLPRRCSCRSARSRSTSRRCSASST